jgi:hypothetical protein
MSRRGGRLPSRPAWAWTRANSRAVKRMLSWWLRASSLRGRGMRQGEKANERGARRLPASAGIEPALPGPGFLLAKTQLAPRTLPCSEKALEHGIYSRRHKAESDRHRKCMQKSRRGRIRPRIDSAQEYPRVFAQSAEDLAGPRAPARGIAHGSVDARERGDTFRPKMMSTTRWTCRKRRAPSLKVTSSSRSWGRSISKAMRVGVNSTSRGLRWPA